MERPMTVRLQSLFWVLAPVLTVFAFYYLGYELAVTLIELDECRQELEGE